YTRTLAEMGKESLPFSVQAALEEGPLAAATSAVGLQGSPMTPVERRNFARDEVARELFGVPYGELESAEQRAQVNMDERVARWHQEALERRMEGGGDDARRAESDIEFRAKMEAN